jgi:IS5 family transposase
LPPAQKRAKGGQFALHAKALPGNPYDDHTLASVIPEMKAMIDNGIERLLADAGYRGQNAPLSHRFKVFTCRMTPAIKREMRRRAAIETVIGHLKSEHRMGCNYLAHERAMRSMPSSPLPATTSASSSSIG